MKLFFHSLGETVDGLQDKVICGDQGCWEKLRPKPSTSVSVGDSWWEDRFLMALFLKFVWSSWRIRRLVFPKFFVVRISGKSPVNEGMEYGRLGCGVLPNFLEPSLWFLLMCAWKKEGRLGGETKIKCVIIKRHSSNIA